MLENFLFSINAVAPLFLVLFLGYALKKTNFLSDGFVSSGNKMVFFIALPAILFINVYTTELGELLDWGFAALAVGLSIASFIGIWLIGALFIKDKCSLGAFAQGAFRGNLAFLGMPLLINIAGDAGAARAALLLAFVLPVYNISTVILLAASSESGKKVGVKTIILTIVKNPFIIAVVLAFALQLLDIRLPFIVDRTVIYASNMATPLALICLGAGMNFQGFDAKFKYAFVASMVKVIILPIVFTITAYLLGFRGYDIAAFMILGGIPSAIAGYAMVVQMGGDGYIAGTIVVISTFLSAFTLTLFIYALRVFGII